MVKIKDFAGNPIELDLSIPKVASGEEMINDFLEFIAKSLEDMKKTKCYRTVKYTDHVRGIVYPFHYLAETEKQD